MIKYLGSKRLLLPLIANVVEGLRVKSVFDVFSGTSRVGYEFKKRQYKVIANDSSEYAWHISNCYILASKSQHQKNIESLVAEYNSTASRSHGYFTETFCEKARFFRPENGERIDFIRDDLEKKSLDPILKSIMLTSLMEAADKVDSTCGIQMAYLKKYAPRAMADLKLQVPPIVDSPHSDHVAIQMDALAAVKHLASKNIKYDVAYLDPPYNQHSYLGNYHIWETLCKWDKPEAYGVAAKRIDVKTTKSAYNFKKQAFPELKKLIESLNCRKVVLSFSNEGYITREQIEAYLASLGSVSVVTKDYKRYVGAQIGIYNPSGVKVGKVSHLRNEEYIYVLEKA